MDPIEKLFNQAGFATQGSQNEPVAPAPVTPLEPPPVTPPVESAAPAAPIEPPPAEPPVTPPIEPAIAAQPINEILKGLAGGKYESAEALNTYISELETKAATEPFANEYIKSWNEAAKNGVPPELFAKIATVDPKKITDREALILQMQWKNPEFTTEDAELLVDNDFRLGQDEDETDQGVRIARLKAKSEATDAREFISQYIADVKTPSIDKQLEVQKAAWSKELPKVAQEFKTIEVKGATGTYQYQVNADVLAKAEKTLSDVINNGNVMALPDEKGMQLAQAIVRNAVIVDSLGSIVDYVTDQIEKKHAIGIHNPKGIVPPPAPVAPAKSEEMKRAEFLAKEIGIKL